MSFAEPIRLADAGKLQSADIGGKASSLAILLAKGLPIPPALVIPWRGFEGDERALWSAVERECAELRFPVAVRSSGSIEDQRDSAAPGLFHSVRRVRDIAGLSGAVAKVRASARSRAVLSYCEARRLSATQLKMSVIIQSEVSHPKWQGVTYTRRPGLERSPDMLVEAFHEGSGERLSMAREGGLSAQSELPAPVLARLRELSLAAERAIGAETGADVEWVVTENLEIFVVQARPIVHPRTGRRPEPPRELLSFSDDGTGRIWRWDATHNPDPLSPAQAGLVTWVNDMGVGASDMRMVGGYLYSTSREIELTFVPQSAAELSRFYDEQVLPEANRALTALEAEAEPALEDALSAYREVYRVYAGKLTPAMRVARSALSDFLAAELGMAKPDAIVSKLLHDRMAGHLAARIERVAAGEDKLSKLLEYAAPMAPAWDVAAPTYAEDPAPIHRSIAAESARTASTREGPAASLRSEIRAQLAGAKLAEFDKRLALSARAKELSEVDDRLFFRAQSVVRRALLHVALRWGVAEDGIFFLDLFDVVGALRDGRRPELEQLKSEVARARAQRAEQKQWAMPLALRAGRSLAVPEHKGGENFFRGAGSGAQAAGRVVRVGDLGAIGPLAGDAIVVAPALSPALVFAALGARAIVSAYGGLLGHGAAMARELGIPCVVQCPGAWHSLADGDPVVVNGDEGLVIRVAEH